MKITAHDPLTPQERQSLTIWGQSFSAQIRDYASGRVLAFYLRDDAPRSTEDGHPVELPEGDIAKLRALLDEAASR